VITKSVLVYSHKDVNVLGRIDTASLLILDHVARAEARLSAQISNLRCANSRHVSDDAAEVRVGVPPARSSHRSQITHPRFGHNGINGDSIMCWPVIQELLQTMPETRKWAVLPDERIFSTARFEPSPSIMLEIKSKVSGDPPTHHDGKGKDQDRAENLDPQRESTLIESYFAHVHSKSPIFDKEWFYSLQAQVTRHCWQPQHYTGPSSSRGLCPTRVCIYLLVLALGHITASEENYFPSTPFKSSLYFDYGLSWMGPALYHQNGDMCPQQKSDGDGEDLREWIEKIQCLILVGTHFMWCMRPWDARKVFGEAAILAKTFMHL
jgi:hypothetical protein